MLLPNVEHAALQHDFTVCQAARLAMKGHAGWRNKALGAHFLARTRWPCALAALAGVGVVDEAWRKRQLVEVGY